MLLFMIPIEIRLVDDVATTVNLWRGTLRAHWIPDFLNPIVSIDATLRIITEHRGDNYWAQPAVIQASRPARLAKSNRVCRSKVLAAPVVRPPPRLACWPRTESQVLESRTEFIDVPAASVELLVALDSRDELDWPRRTSRRIDEFSKRGRLDEGKFEKCLPSPVPFRHSLEKDCPISRTRNINYS